MIIEPTPLEQSFIAAYFEAVYFTDGDDNELIDPSISAYDLRRGTIDCLAFYAANRFLIDDANVVQAGHDFWLTRNRHGSGFWERTDIYGDYCAEQLSVNAEAFAPIDVEFIES